MVEKIEECLGRAERHGSIECLFEFGDYKFVMKLNCPIALFSPVMLSCAGLEEANT